MVKNTINQKARVWINECAGISKQKEFGLKKVSTENVDARTKALDEFGHYWACSWKLRGKIRCCEWNLASPLRSRVKKREFYGWKKECCFIRITFLESYVLMVAIYNAGFVILARPSYPPNLAPNDFFVFPPQIQKTPWWDSLSGRWQRWRVVCSSRQNFFLTVLRLFTITILISVNILRD